MAFTINMFGTSNDDLDSGGSNFEFILHVISIIPDSPVSNFDMFMKFFASSWEFSGGIIRATSVNGSGVDGRVTNNRPQVIHIDQLSPTTFPTLENDCILNPSGGGSCPNPEDIRIISQPHKIIIDAVSPTGYDVDETDAYNDSLVIAKMPVDIVIMADGCRYNSPLNAEFNIYRGYNSSGGLFGGQTNNPDNKIIGEDEIIVI